MRTRLFLRVAAGLPMIAALAAGQPKLRLAEVQDAAPVSYRATLDLDPAKPAFSGTIEIHVSVRKPVETLWLNANKIAVEEASAEEGGKAHTAAAVPGGDDFLGLKFAPPLPAGDAVIHVRYTGEVRHGDSAGVFYLKDKDNDYIFTQFENTDARDAFPCFDEPGYKTPWQLTLRVPAADSAVSNTPGTETSAGGVKTYTFKETKPLPSYLVAFAVGPFEYVNAGTAGKNHVPVRIVTPKGRADEAKYAAEVTATILTRLEDYFGIPYPYEKADQVSVPLSGGFGAMENAGMVTYGQTIILADPASDTISRQRGYAEDCAHELSHQWFGDLVTTAWWNDIWLNEAFATWMEQKLISGWKPEWQTRVEDVDSKLGAEGVDSLVSTRQIRQPIETNDDIANAFDAITYQKGAAVIGMFENWMGPEEFRKGVQAYLRRYAFHNATSADFLDSLSSSSRKDISRPFSTFLNQPGVPAVAITLDCSHAPVLHTEQARSLPAGSQGSTDHTWQIPLCVRYDGAPAAECTLLTQASQDVPLRQAKSCPAWVEGNANAEGYYLVDYRGQLGPALTAHAAKALDAAERVDLIGNASFMARAGKLPAGDALSLVEAFHGDPQRQVVERALGVALAVREDLVPANLMENYRRFLAKNFDARARQLGWLPHAGESDDKRLLRPAVVGAVARYGGDQELAGEARTLADKWLADHKAVPAEVVSSVLTTAAYYGDMALYNRFLDAMLHTQDNQAKQRLLSALAAFREPAEIEAGYQAVLTKKIPLVDGFPLLFAGGSEAATSGLSFDFIKQHFDELTAGHPNIFGNDLGSYLPFSGGAFCDAAARDRFQAFFTPRIDKYPGAPRNFAQILESINLCIAQKTAQEGSVKAFLEKY